MFCPHERPDMQPTWEAGYADALMGGRNSNADNPVYCMGFTQGELDADAESKKERALEERSDPPPRGSLPSISELTLLRHEQKKNAPSIPPPPHKARSGDEFVRGLVHQAEAQLF